MNTKIKVTFAVVACVATVAGFTACTKNNVQDEQTTSAVESTTVTEAVTEPDLIRADETTMDSTKLYRESTTKSTNVTTAGTTNKAPTTVKTTDHKTTVKTTAKETVKSDVRKTTTQAATKKTTTTKAITTKISTTKPTTTSLEKVLYYYPDTGTYGYEPKEGALYQNASGSWESYVKPDEITPEEISESIKDIPHEKWY